MSSKKFYLDSAKTEIISVRWGLFWKNFTAEYNGQFLGQVQSTAALKEGYDFTLPDGRVLTARVQKFGLGLELLLDGQPLPGSATHPYEQINQAFYVLVFIGGMNIFVGFAKMTSDAEFLQRFEGNISYLILGLIYLGLGWWAKSKASSTALYLAIGLYVTDSVLMILLPDGGNRVGIGGLIMRVFFSIALYRGISGAKALRIEMEQVAAL